MTASDVCRRCDGCGKFVEWYTNGLSAIVTCPVCEGIGWDPEAVKREVDAQRQLIDKVKI